MIKLSKRFSRSSSSSKLRVGSGAASSAATGEIKWELRPGGMLVQKRDSNGSYSSDETTITIRVSSVSQWHDVSVQSTSTFGELKILVSLLTKLEPEEQRLLFKGKEREDDEHLHMVGVRDKDKVLVLEDPALKERKLLGLSRNRMIGSAYRTISV